MNTRSIVLGSLLVLALGSFACGVGSNAGNGGAVAPIDIKVNLEDNSAASALITTAGGHLSATAADGTLFTLTLPEGALQGDQQITLTPASTIDGLPFSGGLVGAVQLAPEGLQLLQAATLTIESPKTAAAQGFETVAFGYRQSGKGLYLSPAQVSGQVMSLEVWHFSGDGAAQATGVEVAAQQEQHVPQNPEDAFTQEMQQFEGRERQAQLLGQGDNVTFGETLIAATHRAFRDFLVPQLAIALADCSRAPAILARALGAKRQMEIMGTQNAAGGASSNVFQAELDQLQRTMQQVATNCYNKEYDQCVVDKKIEHKRAMQQIFAEASGLGLAAGLDPSKIDKCPPVVGYTATGQQEEITYSGSICDLAQAFSVDATSAYYKFTMEFAPSSPQGGSYTESGTWFNVGPMDGGGSYTVEGPAEAATGLHTNGSSCTHTPVGTVCRDYQFNIDLVPLEGGRCG
jgi:hypothetical protein